MKIFLFSFKMAIKFAGSAQKIRVDRVSGNTANFRPNFKNLCTLNGLVLRNEVHSASLISFFVPPACRFGTLMFPCVQILKKTDCSKYCLRHRSVFGFT